VFKAKGDWCDEHGFPESYCPICNPDASPPDVGESPTPAADWCAGHGLPESKCTKCNPELTEGFKASGDWCPEHGFPESACPQCNPQPAPAGAEEATIEARVVRFRSDDIERSVGLETVAAERSASASTVHCPAQIEFDADRIAEVRALVPGIVRQLRVEIGAQVQPGDPLVELESTRIGEIQGSLASARERVRTAEAHLARQRELRAQDVVSQRTVELAERELASAKADQRTAQTALRMTGASGSKTSGRYTIAAPIAGTVVRRPAILGQHAGAEESLATIADTSSMWALLDVPEADVGDIAIGQKIRVTLDGRGEGHSVDGELTWISAEVSPRTRAVKARAELPNPEGRLRANQFAHAEIEVGAQTATVVVPRGAVQRVGEHEVVFIRAAPGVYTPKVVQRSGQGSQVSITGDVKVGDQIVTTGAVLLRTEIMPGSIGAGCCEVD
jgi:cobalt-zinc-cadmium efflux system membrane fusion protein